MWNLKLCSYSLVHSPDIQCTSDHQPPSHDCTDICQCAGRRLWPQWTNGCTDMLQRSKTSKQEPALDFVQNIRGYRKHYAERNGLMYAWKWRHQSTMLSGWKALSGDENHNRETLLTHSQVFHRRVLPWQDRGEEDHSPLCRHSIVSPCRSDVQKPWSHLKRRRSVYL